jgi:DNA topoisomerase-2
MSEKKPVYKKLDHISHILLRPETYVGSINTEEKELYVISDITLSDIKVIKKKINYNPAFIKLFDEILVNASDQAIRTGKVKIIKVNIGDDSIEVENDGPSIPIELHSEEKVYNPELIFAHLLTGENYEDSEERVVGGRNGLGAKLASIFSTKFIIDCCDDKKKYKQIIKNNMRDIATPTIKDANGEKSYTSITYFPELTRFKLNKIDDDSKSLMMKRCLDVAVYNPKVRMIVNGKTLPIKSAKDYMKMHISDETELFYEKLDNGWEVGIAKSPTEQFEQVSIVNGISTYKGGTHVNYISLQLAKDVADSFSKKIKANWLDVKNKVFLFLISQIPNPEFDSQTKENLMNYMSKEIHKGCQVSQGTVKKIMKSEIVESILYALELKEKEELRRLQKNQQKAKVEKLVDANSKDRKKCQLFMFEGDSAGDATRKFRDPQTQAIFKLKGKFVNASKTTDKQLLVNAKDGKPTEAANLINAIGLELNKKLNPDELRFGEILICCDMDTDGDSIVGLLLNFFAKWKELFDMGLIYRVCTPLLVIKKGKDKKYFYTTDEWEEFQKKNSLTGWNIEYKKGLGALEDDEYQDMIQNPRKVQLIWDEEAKTYLECWFGDDSELRKKQLS